MAVLSCRTHPDVTSAEVCRECRDPWCVECLAEADGLVLPICRPCALVVPSMTDRLAVAEETMRFSPRTVDGWVVQHGQAG